MSYVLGILIGLLVLWALAVLALLAIRPKGFKASDAARLMPDVVLLLRDLAREHALPRRVRARIWLLLVWIASPIDLIPDVIPIVGVLDDVVLAYFVLRSVARAAGQDVLARHWRGSPESLAALEQLLRLRDAR